MVTHFAVMKPNAYGGHKYRTLCGRENRQSQDGMNSSGLEAAVTCRFCLKALIQQHLSAVGSLRVQLEDQST